MRRIAGLCPSEAKTDAEGAAVIADALGTVFHTSRSLELTAEITDELTVVAGSDQDLATRATRTSNRIRGLLTSFRPRPRRVMGPVVCPRRDGGGSPRDSVFPVPGEARAGRRDVRHTVRSHERVMHPGPRPVSLVVVSVGNRESDERYSGHRSHPGQGLRRLPGHRRVLNVQQQSHQRFLSFSNIDEGSKVAPGTNTVRP
ncbi:hypothetical protein GCM10010267_65490 [Streptomyces griseorubens]|jgi:hypothetical protein|nr:hypothetical protein GCM10010267_65490 [Streptomyces griseorubens]